MVARDRIQTGGPISVSGRRRPIFPRSLKFSGMVHGLIANADGRDWRAAFISGLLLAPVTAGLTGFTLSAPQMPSSWVLISGAGLLVGFGSRLGSGCTSGHGVCGIARLSPRSIVATLIFIGTAIVVVAIARHVLGG